MKTFGVVGPVLKAMETAKMDPIFSLYLKGGGSSENGGEITFGGNNEARIKKDSAVKAAILAGGKFLIQMDEVKFGDSQICTKAGEAYCKALMDSGASLITGPQKEIAAFNNDILSEFSFVSTEIIPDNTGSTIVCVFRSCAGWNSRV